MRFYARRWGSMVALVLLVGCGAATREVTFFYAPVFDSTRQEIRYVRLTAEEKRPRVPLSVGLRRPRWEAARAVVEWLPVDDGDPRVGAELWSARGDGVSYLESVWQLPTPAGIEVGLCMVAPDGVRSFRRVTLSKDARRVLSETAAPAREGDCPPRERIELHQPMVFDDARRREVLAPPADPLEHPRSAGILIYDWERRDVTVRLAPPAGLGLSEAAIRHDLERTDTPLRWRRRPAYALSVIEGWIPENPHPWFRTVRDVIDYRTTRSAWDWWGPEWNREYRGRGTWKITARFTRRRLDGRSQRIAAAWRVRFQDPHGPEVRPLGPNAWRFSRLRVEETAGITEPGDPDALTIDDHTVSVDWRTGGVDPDIGETVSVLLYCENRLLGEGSVKVRPARAGPEPIAFDRAGHPCRSRYHWIGPWVQRAGIDSPEPTASPEPWFVLDADETFIARDADPR